MPNQPPAARSRTETSFLAVFTAVFVIGPLWLYLSAFSEAQHQYTVNCTYEPTEARMLSVMVTSYKGDRGMVHFQVEAQYQYTVGGKTHRSGQLAPLSIWGSEDWANDLAAKYKVGEPCRAFYDPNDPSQAVLIRSRSFTPYIEMLQMVFCLPAGFFLFTQMWYARKREPVPAENGWFEIPSELSERLRLLRAKGTAAIWYVLLGITAGHYLLCVSPPYRHSALIFFAVVALLGLMPLNGLVRCLRMRRNFDGARFLMDQPVAILGRQFRFSLSLTARRQFEIKHARIRLVCADRTSKNRHILFEATLVEVRHRMLYPGEKLELLAALDLPITGRPTGLDVTGEFDRIAWAIHMDCEPAEGPAYRLKIPITVQKLPEDMPGVASGQRPSVFADVRPIDPKFAGQILTKRNIVMVYLLGSLPMIFALLGVIMMVCAIQIVSPKDSDATSLFNWSRSEGLWLLVIGVITQIAGLVWGIGWPKQLSGGFLHSVAKRNVQRRRDAIVLPDLDSVYVDIIPRCNWNRVLWENASDIGFLKVDVARREILFEGDRQRYRISDESLLSCELEASVCSATAPKQALRLWLVVIRAVDSNGIWEAPISPRLFKRNVNTKKRLALAQELQKKIQALMRSRTGMRQDPKVN